MQLKKVLSGNAEGTIHVESLQDDKDASGRISREEFEQLSVSLVDSFVKPVTQVNTRYHLFI